LRWAAKADEVENVLEHPSATELEAALVAAGEAHHEYEQVFLSGVHDEQWPGFYAAFVLGRLGGFATPTSLVGWLRDAPSSGEWEASAARYVLERLKDREMRP
jgi:hypothetical protein